MRYQVFDCGRPADCFHSDGIDKSWNNSIFDSMNDAKDYLKNWLGELAECINIDAMKANQQIDYDGYGDIVEIKAIDDIAENNEFDKELDWDYRAHEDIT